MIKVKTTHYGQDYATIEVSNGSEKHELEVTIGMGEAIDRMNKQTSMIEAAKAEVHKITWNKKTYFKVYGENLNGRMILVTKTRFKTLKEAKNFAATMLPSHKLEKKVRTVTF